MIFTDKTILESIDSEQIVIKHFISANVGTNSVDLTLNEKILVYNNAVNYNNEEKKFKEISPNTFQDVPYIEGNFIDCREKNETIELYIPESGMILVPGQLYIASTNEYTETHNAVPKLEGKSSIGRLGLFVHVTAGYGDVGFCGTWTLELVATVPIKIYPNMKICQISYHGISHPPLVKYSDKSDAKYSGQIGATASKMEENFVNQ